MISGSIAKAALPFLSDDVVPEGVIRKTMAARGLVNGRGPPLAVGGIQFY